MNKLKNITTGEVLQEEFMIPFQISSTKIAKDIGVSQTRIYDIIKGNRRISVDTALRLSIYFGNSAKFWLGLQDDYDLEFEKEIKQTELNQIIPSAKYKNIEFVS